MRSLITDAGVAHELHVLDFPDAFCKLRLHQRNADGEHPYPVSDETYDLFTRYFVPPSASEGFNVVIHAPCPPQSRPRPRDLGKRLSSGLKGQKQQEASV
jgi:hypothetical protein